MEKNERDEIAETQQRKKRRQAEKKAASNRKAKEEEEKEKLSADKPKIRKNALSHTSLTPEDLSDTRIELSPYDWAPRRTNGAHTTHRVPVFRADTPTPLDTIGNCFGCGERGHYHRDGP